MHSLGVALLVAVVARAFVRVRAGDAPFVLHIDLAAKKLLQRF